MLIVVSDLPILTTNMRVISSVFRRSYLRSVKLSYSFCYQYIAIVIVLDKAKYNYYPY